MAAMMRERTLYAHVWIALYRPRVMWGGPYPYTAVMTPESDGSANPQRPAVDRRTGHSP